MKELLRNAFRTIGYDIRRRNARLEENPFYQYEFGAEAIDAINAVRGFTMVPEINLLTLYEQVIYCEKNNIPGAFVECGVWKGGSVGLMAIANQKHGKSRRELHMFDAFDDICEPDPEVDGVKSAETIKFLTKQDDVDLKGRIKPIKGVYDYLGGHGTIDACNELLIKKVGYESEKLFYHKGWFEEVMEEESKSVGDIAILRLDGDWYSSTKVSLEHLYDKVVKGGLVVIDDYGYYEGCSKAVNEFLASRNIVTFLSYSNFSCRYFVKR